MLNYVVLIHSDPNNMNSIVYHLIIERYSMKALHWNFPWATASHLYNMADRGEKLQQLHCYHPFSDSLDIYLTKNHYENYSPKVVPIAKIWGSGSWTKWRFCQNRVEVMYGWFSHDRPWIAPYIKSISNEQYQWLNARFYYLHCSCTGDAVLQ